MRVIPAGAADRDWSAYNSEQSGRPVRPLIERAARLAGPGAGRQAVELGCGVGVEAQFLARRGWHVATYDADATCVAPLAELARTWPIRHTTTRLEALDILPSCDLLVANAVLSFVPRESFVGVWNLVRAALAPGAVIAFDVFGVRDDWSRIEGSFFTGPEVEALVAGWHLDAFDERDEIGASFSGRKRWHVFEVVARRPMR